MEQNQHQQPDAAAQKFPESLDKFEGVLEENSTEDEVVLELHFSGDSDPQIDEDWIDVDLEAFEEAVADIEQYLEDHKK
jgi:hypothetical protein